MRLDINYREKKLQENTNSWRLNNTLPNNKEVTEERRREIKRFLETNDNENTMGFSKSSSKREVYSNTVLQVQTRKASNRQPNSTSKAAGKRRTKKKTQN